MSSLQDNFIKARKTMGSHIICAVKMDIGGSTLQKCIDGNFEECTPKTQKKLKEWLLRHDFL